MKRICITYHMYKNHGNPSDEKPSLETVETCITLPMRDEVADDIISNGTDSYYLCSLGEVRRILEAVSELQGYFFKGVVAVEEAHSKTF